MEAIKINELDTKQPKKKVVQRQEVVKTVIPRFMVWTVGILLTTNLITGGVIYAHKNLLTEYWRNRIHEMTAPAKVQAKEEIKATPKPTIEPSPTVYIVDPKEKGGCDLSRNELHEGVCYPKAGY